MNIIFEHRTLPPAILKPKLRDTEDVLMQQRREAEVIYEYEFVTLTPKLQRRRYECTKLCTDNEQ